MGSLVIERDPTEYRRQSLQDDRVHFRGRLSELRRVKNKSDTSALAEYQKAP